MHEAIRVENLAYTYPGVDDTPGVAVFEDLDLTVEEGTFVAVLGTNGCGKSTLAKHFNAILLPTGLGMRHGYFPGGPPYGGTP